MVVTVIPAAMVTVSGLREAGDVPDGATANGAAHAGVEVAATAFEFDIAKADIEAAWTDLTHAVVVIDVNVAETGPIALALHGANALVERFTFELAHFPWALAPLIGAVMAAIVPVAPAVALITSAFLFLSSQQ